MTGTDPAAVDALVIGAGPAGLMAAEVLSQAGRCVVIADGKPSAARKFLMAGKSGLNLAKAGAEPRAWGDWLAPMVAAFGSDAVAEWSRDLGQEVFTGTSGRVFPVAMKASPLLRAWLLRLGAAGVELRTRWRWEGFANVSAPGPAGSDGDAGHADRGLVFTTPEGARTLRPAVTVLALGGASWPRLGSDAAWVPWLRDAGVGVTSFEPANMGFHVDWSAHMARHFGAPVKAVALSTSDGGRERGEFVVTAKGLEGGGLYAVGRALRMGAALTLDLAPDLTEEALATRLARARRGDTMTARLRKAGLSPVAAALVMEWARPVPEGTALAQVLKALPVPLGTPMGLGGAISSAGGVRRDAVTDRLMLRAVPGVFACGEMLDWEAPTGGYLLTGCLATGRWAGLAAAEV